MKHYAHQIGILRFGQKLNRPIEATYFPVHKRSIFKIAQIMYVFDLFNLIEKLYCKEKTMREKYTRALICILFIYIPVAFLSSSYAQDPDKFKKEVEALSDKYQQEGWEKGGVVFTGSSSIRLWKTLEKDFPKANIINTGFGGSQTHNLIQYLDKLVLEFEPKKIFIYEGDNDLNAGKPVRQILEEFSEIMEKATDNVPNAQFYFISAKPSPSRWDKKGQYELFNEQLKQFAMNHSNANFIDIWTPMLGKDGKPKPELFVADNLHMNEKGYAIWKKAVKAYLD
ncbi:SGNH/GDSL hydrolase family protein [Aquiflexum sp.]|uniref:SGNH/GDSL hydrolase family protein n=1 Tax=Aquiflexum sp. TaxID=1872584 RepID=UPI0035938163